MKSDLTCDPVTSEMNLHESVLKILMNYDYCTNKNITADLYAETSYYCVAECC